MNQKNISFIVMIFSLAAMVLTNSFFTVSQAEQAVLTQFGQPVGGPILQPGLHWKTPFIQQVHKFDRWILEWDGDASETQTSDKKRIWIDVTGRWRIIDPLTFFKTLHSERIAQSRLDDIMDGFTKNVVNRYKLIEVVRSTNRIIEQAGKRDDIQNDEAYERVSVGRDEITRQILEQARAVAKDYGIEITDLRIKRINYIPSVQLKVFERMISERKRAAEELRSEGQGIRAEIEGKKEKELMRITSEAYRTAQALKGKADAEATTIYGDAYSQDPDYYAFTNTLEKYPQTLKDGKLILTTDSDFLRFLKDAPKS